MGSSRARGGFPPSLQDVPERRRDGGEAIEHRADAGEPHIELPPLVAHLPVGPPPHRCDLLVPREF